MKEKFDVIVVGAGPAGTTAARYAAENGAEVLVLEKDRDLGYPVRCAEAVSKAGIEEFIKSDPKWIASDINKFSLISPDDTEVVLEFKEQGYVLDRKLFDYELGRIASKAGALIRTKCYVNSLLMENGRVTGVKWLHKEKEYTAEADIVIGADGVESRVGRWAGLKTTCDIRDMESCAQVTASNINVDPNTIYFYFGAEVAPQGYLWVFPKGDDIANIGLGVSGLIGKKKSAQRYLNEFLDRKFPGASALTTVAGGVPCCPTLDRIAAPGIMLVGDAARQVNPLSGGGIASGMIAGSMAGRIAAEIADTGDHDKVKAYEKEWHKRLGKRHETFDKIKNGIYDFSDQKFNNIAHSFSKVPNEKRTLGSLFRTALVNNPSLLVDVAKVFIK